MRDYYHPYHMERHPKRQSRPTLILDAILLSTSFATFSLFLGSAIAGVPLA